MASSLNTENSTILDDYVYNSNYIMQQLSSKAILAALLMNNKPGMLSMEDIAEKYPIVMECLDAGEPCDKDSFTTVMDPHYFKCFTYKPSDRPRQGLVNGVTFTFLSGGGIVSNLTFNPHHPIPSLSGYDDPFNPSGATDGIHLVIHERGTKSNIHPQKIAHNDDCLQSST